MRILFYNNRYYPAFGGVETYLAQVTEQLVKSGHSVTVITTAFLNTSGYDRVNSPSKEILNGVSVLRVPAFRLFGQDAFTFPYGLFKHVSLINKSDLLHYYTFGYLSSVLIAFLKLVHIIKVPTIFQPHYAPNRTFGRVAESIYRFLFGKLLVSTSQAVVLLTPTFFTYFETLHPKKIAIIPPPVKILPTSPEQVNIDLRRSLGIPDNHHVMFSVSRLTKGKGLAELLDGYAAANLDNIHLVIAGRGPYARNLEEKIAGLHLAKKVSLLTEVDDTYKAKLYNIADSFALLSYSAESFGITLVEAMRFGLPILASNYGAIPYVLKTYSNSVILPNLAPTSVAQGIREVLTLKKTIPLSNDPFTAENIVRLHLALYSEILSANRNTSTTTSNTSK